ncbi:MAG: DNA replication and repair protein RecF, partial [Phenylobacterium sp.]
MTVTALTRIALRDFRSYAGAEVILDGRPVWLAGPYVAGKTNLLEAVSLLIPGRGLRGSALNEMGRRAPGEPQGRPWAISVSLRGAEGETRLGTGVELAGGARRVVRVEGEPAPPGRLSEHVRQVWLTPAQDRLFLEGAADRRRFLDRLVYAAEPAHAAHVQAYEKAMLERMRLLTDGPADPVWLDALEARLAQAGALMAAARARSVAALAAEIDGRGDRPFPQARLALTGVWERLAAEGAGLDDLEARLTPALREARTQDAAAGRALTGPHRGDLAVTHVEKDRPAADCSTGEQKALVLNLVLAQAARLARA